MQPTRSVPIYFVIFDMVNIFPICNNIGPLRAIRQVIPCDVSELEEVYQQYVAPLYSAGQRIQVFYVLREPPSPFHDWRETAKAWEHEDTARAEAEREELRRYFARIDEKPGALPGDP